MGTAMEDLSGFAASHPEFSDPKGVRIPGHGSLPPLQGARPFELTAESLSSYRVEAAKDPNTLPTMLKIGPEAVAFYVSFRLFADRWGIYVREGALRALKDEYHRIIWRDLGKYADRNVDDVAEKVETTLVLDYLLSHNRVHFLVDRAAAQSEIEAGAAKYAPYQAKWYNAPPKPVPNPEDVGNLEEALANLEAFRQYINPTYADGVAKLVEGRLDERNVNEWKAFFIGGRFAVEMANVFSRQPPGGRLGRRAELVQVRRIRFPAGLPAVTSRRWMGARSYGPRLSSARGRQRVPRLDGPRTDGAAGLVLGPRVRRHQGCAGLDVVGHAHLPPVRRRGRPFLRIPRAERQRPAAARARGPPDAPRARVPRLRRVPPVPEPRGDGPQRDGGDCRLDHRLRPGVHGAARDPDPEGTDRTVAIRGDRRRVRRPRGHDFLRPPREPVHVPRLGRRPDRRPARNLFGPVRGPRQGLPPSVSSLNVRRVEPSDWDGHSGPARNRDGTKRPGGPQRDGSPRMDSRRVSRDFPDVPWLRDLVQRLAAHPRGVCRRIHLREHPRRCSRWNRGPWRVVDRWRINRRRTGHFGCSAGSAGWKALALTLH